MFGSNLVLANREARLTAPSGLDSPPENQWAALRAAHRFVGQKPESLILEPTVALALWAAILHPELAGGGYALTVTAVPLADIRDESCCVAVFDGARDRSRIQQGECVLAELRP